MKFNKFLIGLVLLVSIISLTAFAAPPPAALSGFSAQSTYTFGTTNFAVVSANGKLPVAAVTFLSAYSDGTNAVKFWTPSTGQSSASNATTTVYMTQSTSGYATNGFVVGQPVVIRHLATDTYEVRSVATITTTAITVNSAPTTAITAGDLVYPYLSGPTISFVNSAYLTIGPAPYIYIGAADYPILASVTCTTTGAINTITGTFIQ